MLMDYIDTNSFFCPHSEPIGLHLDISWETMSITVHCSLHNSNFSACHFALQSFKPWQPFVGLQILPYGWQGLKDSEMEWTWLMQLAISSCKFKPRQSFVGSCRVSDPPIWVTGLVALQDGMDLAHAACHFILQVQALAIICRVL